MSSEENQYNTDDADNEQEQGPSKSKKAKYTNKWKKQKFNKDWLTNPALAGWLEGDENDSYKCKCSACNVYLVCGKTVIIRHSETKKHKDKVSLIRSNNNALKNYFKPKEVREPSIQVKNFEIRLSAFFAEHNVAFQVIEHLLPLLKEICPDSDILKTVNLGRTKCTSIVKNVIAENEKLNLISTLRMIKFSVLLDESTDLILNKTMCVVVYLSFLLPVLDEVQRVNKNFESAQADPLKLHEDLMNLVKSVANTVINNFRQRNVEILKLSATKIDSMLDPDPYLGFSFKSACRESNIEGCDFRGKGDAMKVHQTKCKFTTILCALRFNSCQWQGHRKDLMAHCNDVHPENTYTNNEQKLLVPDFPTLMHRHYYILFEVYETLFRCTWDLSIDTGTMRFAVYILEQNTTKGKFSYQVSMFTPDNEIAVLLRGPCVLLEDDSKRFLGDKYLSAKHGMAKEFCDEDGYFHYGIKLINHSL
ncbi:unnamed protein product [Phaedon cochleariae]|uniref:Uncharacterized protein n=1 Tax=Phaedon cochleariae TaxID=80249 RepID=A0A9N9SN62_PHACE|nr:unnamed protein product [Phaedon cochleariae]